MAKGNAYYDTRNNKVYYADELSTLDTSSKTFIKMVPSGGIIKDGYYYKLNSEDRNYQKETDKVINIVNEHSKKIKEINERFEQIQEKKAMQYDVNERIRFSQRIAISVENSIQEDYFDQKARDEARNAVIKQIRQDFVNEDFDYLTSEDIENAFENGKNSAPVKKAYRREKHLKQAITVAITLFICLSIKFGVELKDRITINRDVNNANIAISQLSYDENDKGYVSDAYRKSSNAVNIVSQNTRRSTGSQYFYYDNSAIAKDLLKLPAYAIDMGIYQVYVKMDTNRDNPGHHNLDDVIYYLKVYSQGNEAYEGKFSNCNTFNDYLIRNGFYTVDESNKKVANEASWVDYQRKTMSILNDKLKNDAKVHIEELQIGGK